MSNRLTEKLIQRQINHWNRLREFLPERSRTEEAVPGPVVTISRQTGAGGRTLAVGLCERLGLRLQDRSLVEHVVRTEKLDPAMVAQLDEQELRPSELWVRGVLKKRIFLADQYRRALGEAVDELAAPGGVVFLGRGANHLLGDRADLHVRLMADPERRTARLQEKHQLDQAAAQRLREETDRRRQEFVRKLFGVDPDDGSLYDLVLNTDRLDSDSVLETVMLALLCRRTCGSGVPARQGMLGWSS